MSSCQSESILYAQKLDGKVKEGTRNITLIITE